MKRLALSKSQCLITGLCLIAVGLIANEWVLTALLSADGILSLRNVILIWLFDAFAVSTGLMLAIFRSTGKTLEFWVGIALTAAIIWGAEKAFYRLNHPPASPPDPNAPPAEPAPPPPYHQGTYTEGFFIDDPLVGYLPAPNSQVNSTKRTTEGIIYDVTYTIDEYSRRVSPLQNPGNRPNFLLVFGGSFVFGEGVNDDQTLPSYLGQLAPAYQPYNYGVSGFGPQQMLAKLQSDDLPREVPQSEGIAVYVFIDAHVERAIGSMFIYNAWGARMPYYYRNRQGDLVRKGDFRTGRPFVSALYYILGQSEIARYFKVNIPPRLTDKHYAFTAQIIAEARDTFKAKYHSDRFYVLVYPDEGDYFEDMEPHFKAYGLNVLNYDERMKLDADAGLGIAGDRHPTGKAHQIVAEWVVEDLNLNDDD